MTHCDPCKSPCTVPDYPDCLDTLWDKLETLKACFCAELENSLGGPVCECAIVAGTNAVFDNCCAGTAWLLVQEVYPSDAFPSQNGDRVRCDTHSQAATIELGVVRCAPSVDDRGNPPTLHQKEQSARVIHSDRVRMMKAVRCCFTPEQGCDDIVFGGWVPVSEQGGCIGGSMTVTISLGTYGCECECDENGDIVRLDD